MSDPVKRPWEKLPHTLVILEGVSIDEFQELWSECDQTAKSYQFWIGDALIYAEKHYGEDYAQFVDPHYAEQHRGPMWVCKQIEPRRRRANLSYSLHKEVAALDKREQDRWLNKAAKDRWSVSRLREEMGRTKPRRQHNNPPEPIKDDIPFPVAAASNGQERSAEQPVEAGNGHIEPTDVDLKVNETLPLAEPRADPETVPSDRLEELRWVIEWLRSFNAQTSLDRGLYLNQKIAEATRSHAVFNWVGSTDNAIMLIPGDWFFGVMIQFVKDGWRCELVRGDRPVSGFSAVLSVAVCQAALAAILSDLEQAKKDNDDAEAAGDQPQP